MIDCMCTLRKFITASILLAAVSLPIHAQKKSALIKVDDTTYFGFSQSRGPHIDIRAKSNKQRNEVIKVYTGRFNDPKFNPNKYKIQRLTPQRAIVPYFALSPGFKRMYLNKLWPDTKVADGFMIHKVRYTSETLWTVAQLYTGFGNNYKAIKKASGLRDNGLRRGMTLKIPYKLLMALLKEDAQDQLPDLKVVDPPLPEQDVIDEETEVKPVVTPPTTNPDPPPKKKVAKKVEAKKPEKKPDPAVAGKKAQPAKTKPGAKKKSVSSSIQAQLNALAKDRKDLVWGRTKSGVQYAEYRLKRGEAIYSAVVARFCGLVRASDVNKVAKELIKFNNIRDVRDLPVGKRIRIPYEYLEAEYKDEAHPDYNAVVNNFKEVAQVATRTVSKNLNDVYVILDAGHGGRDPGADRVRVWEDDYVYDILCRIKARLEKESQATVYSTIIDPSVQYKVQDVTQFRRDQDEYLLSTPKFKLNHHRVTTDGVNLRWMIANNHYHRLVKKGIKPENIVFASIHADALHPSIRGAMIYVPDSRIYPKNVSAPARLTRYKEKAGSNFTNTRKGVQAAQARSTTFASNFMDLARSKKIRFHRQKPIRSLIYRNPTRPFVPAVLRFNRIPTRVLIETCNLSNPNDQNLLKRPDFRQRMADVFVNALYRTYEAAPQASVSNISDTTDRTAD